LWSDVLDLLTERRQRRRVSDTDGSDTTVHQRAPGGGRVAERGGGERDRPLRALAASRPLSGALEPGV